MKDIYTYTIELLRFVLNGEKPDMRQDINYEKLFNFSKSHGIENMIYVALRDLEADVPRDIMSAFKQSYEVSIMIEAMQALELQSLTETFERNRIDNIPLKGSVIKYLYPMPDYRRSGDIDILIKPADEPKMNKILSELGYEREDDREPYDVHFSYRKPPFIELEMHRRLVKVNNRSYSFCETAWNNTVRKKEYKYQYDFNNEFQYVYLLSHLCHHLYHGGAGIKLVTDIYVLMNTAEFDKVKLAKYLKKANLSNLNEMVIGIINKWFYDAEIKNNDVLFLEEIIMTSGSFGNIQMKKIMNASDTGGSKCIRLLRKLFPSFKYVAGRYPVLDRRPYLTPFFYVYRYFEICFRDKDSVSKKLSNNFDRQYHDDRLTNIVKAIRDI